jgi:predicted deacylase
MKERSMILESINFDAGGVQYGTLRVPHSVNRSAYGHIAIPIATIKNGAGPTVLLTGGVHGDEYEGPIALSKLVRRINIDDVSGRIIIIPALNYPAFLSATRVSPIDGVNLNRTFPGKRDGSVTEMIAHYVTSRLLPISDYLFDFHAGGSSLQYLPGVLAPFAHQERDPERATQLLNAFAPKRIYYYDSDNALSGEDRVLGNYARKAGVSFLCGEFGGGSSVNLEGLQTVEQGLIRYLREIGVLRSAACNVGERAATQSFSLDGHGLMAFSPKTGFFEPAFELGQRLQPGDVAGSIYDLDDPWAQPVVVKFERGGVAVCIRTYSMVQPGDCLGHLAAPID